MSIDLLLSQFQGLCIRNKELKNEIIVLYSKQEQDGNIGMSDDQYNLLLLKLNDEKTRVFDDLWKCGLRLRGYIESLYEPLTELQQTILCTILTGKYIRNQCESILLKL